MNYVAVTLIIAIILLVLHFVFAPPVARAIVSNCDQIVAALSQGKNGCRA